MYHEKGHHRISRGWFDKIFNLKFSVKFSTCMPEFTVNINSKINTTHEHLLTEIRFTISKQE